MYTEYFAWYIFNQHELAENTNYSRARVNQWFKDMCCWGHSAILVKIWTNSIDYAKTSECDFR